jgi:dihydropyrimidine dehydrogenase (NAD+) subunit PreA
MLHINEEAARCLLCEDAPCTKVCINGDPARAIRAIRFDNIKNAGRWIADCKEADLERAEQACIHYDQPIRIRELLRPVCCDGIATNTTAAADEAPSLSITFCGIKCENPFFLASSAVCTNYEMVARAFDMGWAGVFYKTICKQDIREVSPRFDAIKEGTSFAGFRNMEQLSENPYEVDFDILRRLKQNYPSKIVIASIMGQFEEEWIELAKMAEFAGCDAVELNFSCPQMRLAGMGSDVGQDHELVTAYTAYVKQNVKIPVIPKMTPNITHMKEPAMGAYFAGADAISAINTIKSVTFSPEAEVSEKKTVSGYSGRAVKPIAQRFILELAQNSIMRGLELSGIGGIETWRDALEYIQIGCRNVQVCTAVMEYGYRIIDDLMLGMQTYLTERSLAAGRTLTLEDLVGEQLPSFVLPSELDRETMVLPKIDREKCMGCGRCHISCTDGGHQAIAFDLTERKPHIIGQKCVGCHLCRLVCPTGAIGMSKRFNKAKP